MKDINRELNDIILKYKLDKHYPRFRKRLLGEEILIKWINRMPNNGILCVGVDQEDINYFSHLFYNYGKKYLYCLYPDKKENDISGYDHIVVISKKYKNGLINWCEQFDKPVTFLYDYFELNGIYYEDEIYKIIESDYSDMWENSFPAKKGWKEIVLVEFCIQKEKFDFARQEQYRYHYAEKLFFLSLYIKNFLQAKFYQKVLSKSGNYESQMAWEEVQILLKEIKKELRSRSQTDIIMVWMDAVSFGSGTDMKYLQKQIEGGISYENVFTVTPHTNPTAQTLFLGKKLIDDKLYAQKKIMAERSPVLLDLKKHGYSCKVISGYLVVFEDKLQSSSYHQLFAPCSEIFWDMLNNLLIAKTPVFLIAHALMEGHAPHLSTGMAEEDLSTYSVLRNKGHLELDEQLEFYMGFLGREAIKIFMSDHGQPQVREQFHTYFVVTGNRFRPRIEKELFSYVDFPKLIHGILEGDALEQPLFQREYAEVQMLDKYNEQIIGNIIKNRKPLLLNDFGYFGVITKDYLYLKYHIGKEFLMRWNDEGFEPHLLYRANDICDISLLSHFRSIINGRTVDIEKDDKFRYTRYLYRVYENFTKKYKRIFMLVNQLFEEYPEQSVALRMGGAHSAELYYILTTENRKKLAYIIDENSNCQCKKLGLPIISINQLDGKGIQAVVLSTYDHLEELRKEIPAYPQEIFIIDIYQSLENRGIYCDKNFYAVNYMTEEDYNVGFPIEK